MGSFVEALVPVEVDVGERDVDPRQGLSQHRIAAAHELLGEAPRQPED
jgi:hypothetical protein